MRNVPTARPPSALRQAAPWLVAAVVLATVGLPSVAALGSLPAAPEVGVARLAGSNATLASNLTDAPAFQPRYLSAPAGASVSIRLVNVGNYTHSFTLSAKPNVVLSSTLTPAEVYRFFATNGSLANVSVASGTTGWANFTVNASDAGDSFEFVSVVPYQFQAGMWGLFNVSLVGPGLLLSENTTSAPGFVPDVLSASPARYPAALDVLVTNLGALSHTFTVASQSNVTLSPANFTTYFVQHAPLVSASVPSGTGASAWANLTIFAPGVYEYICEIPGHFAAGMFGFLYVGVPVPAAPAAPSTALVDTWVLVGSGALVGVGVLIAAVAAFSGRFPRSPPSHGGYH